MTETVTESQREGEKDGRCLEVLCADADDAAFRLGDEVRLDAPRPGPPEKEREERERRRESKGRVKGVRERVAESVPWWLCVCVCVCVCVCCGNFSLSVWLDLTGPALS